MALGKRRENPLGAWLQFQCPHLTWSCLLSQWRRDRKGLFSYVSVGYTGLTQGWVPVLTGVVDMGHIQEAVNINWLPKKPQLGFWSQTAWDCSYAGSGTYIIYLYLNVPTNKTGTLSWSGYNYICRRLPRCTFKIWAIYITLQPSIREMGSKTRKKRKISIFLSNIL